MGKSKELFAEMQIQSMDYHHSFNKKTAKKTGSELGQNLIQNGEVNLYDALGNIVRMKEVLTAAEAEIKSSEAIYKEADAKGGYNRNGINFSTSSTGDRLDYDKDPVYKAINEQLKDRKAELDLAFKKKQKGQSHFIEAFDPETGEQMAQEVPVVPIKTHGKQTIKITY
jgi:hypothetical protein